MGVGLRYPNESSVDFVIVTLTGLLSPPGQYRGHQPTVTMSYMKLKLADVTL